MLHHLRKLQFLGLLITIPVFPQDYHLYLRNDTDDTIKIVRERGSYVVLPAKGYLASAAFRPNSYVWNEINGKKVCSWYLSPSTPDFKPKGLTYGYKAGVLGCYVET